MTDAPPLEQTATLQSRVAQLLLRDERRLDRLLRRPAGQRPDDLVAQVEAAEARLAARRAAVPLLRYPAELPIVGRRDELVAAIRDHQVVVIAGETGSGKSTQLPKLCLEAGRGVRGMIGHTQPRRLAARTVAERVAEELGTTVGDAVGYTVRFTDTVGDGTFVKVMTDGILLAEMPRDRWLGRYDTLIIDEAHERSLNIDFLLGYLHQLLPRRPDLKLIITSATIDTERFAQHFGDAPVISVSGRTYPVEVRYRPVEGADGRDRDRDQTQAICDAVSELRVEGPGDVLVFLSGEREIRDTADALRAMELPDTDVLPLYARLSIAEQHRVFQPHRGRRLVLATNVAETSLTVPGIRYVVDPGTARVSRFNRRTKVQRLPIEAVSQASAEQRAGRCGRVAPGICIRLYAEDDFDTREPFTEPEILRTNLASVILQMAALGLHGDGGPHDLSSFPFVEPPDQRAVNDGIALLTELGALDPDDIGGKGWLTPLGRRLAQLPVDPRLGRMVLEADRNQCVREVIVIAAALSIQDPRERPTDRQQAAAEAHARFTDPDSDFLGILNLWSYLRERQRELSGNQFRRVCRTEFLNHLRVREWQDVYGQLRDVARGLGIRMQDRAADADAIHRSLLAGLLSHLAVLDEREDPGAGVRGADKGAGGPGGGRRGQANYLGARQARLAIAPGSALARKAPRWVMAAELVETNRLWARVVARARPEWAEELAPHLTKHSYGSVRWDAGRGAATVDESVTLFGLPLVTGRRVAYGRIDPEAAHELFLRHALVEGDWRGRHAFVERNAEVRAEVDELEARARRRDIAVDDETLADFFAERVPPTVTSAAEFDRWWRRASRERPDLLDYTTGLLVADGATLPSAEDFPDEWRQGDLSFPLHYRFAPGEADDGVTVDIPLAVLNRVSTDGFDWHVPGYRAELVAELVRALPKAVRRVFVPVTEHVESFLAGLGRTGTAPAGASRPLRDRLRDHLRRAGGVAIPTDGWSVTALPPPLAMTFRVVGANGRTLAEGKDLDAIRARLGVRMRDALAEAAPSVERGGLLSWTVGTLPPVIEASSGGQQLRGYPALVDEGDSVAVRLLPSEAEQAEAMWAGTRRLLALVLPSPVRSLIGRLTNEAKLGLLSMGYADANAFLEDCTTAALDHLLGEAGGPVWDEAGFEALQAAVRVRWASTVSSAAADATRVGSSVRTVRARLAHMTQPALAPSVDDIEGQLANLVYPGFVTATGLAHLADLPRYLQAVERRLDKLPGDPHRDLERARPVQALEHDFGTVLDALGPAGHTPEIVEVHWMLEELRVSLFAQQLGTAYPVSEKRVRAAIDALSAD